MSQQDIVLAFAGGTTILTMVGQEIPFLSTHRAVSRYEGFHDRQHGGSRMFATCFA